jgi:hypothetical protein
MMITNGGNVGIGTTSPTEKLHVNGDTRIVGNTYVGGIINAYQGDASIWVPNLGQAFTVKQTTGNVGIGTSSPGYKLEVNGNLASLNSSAAGLFSISGTRSIAIQSFAGDWNYIRSNNANLVFGTQDAANLYIRTNDTDRIFVNTSGKVAIGTSDTNSDKSDFTVYTGSGASLALTDDQVRMGGADVNWGVALRSYGALQTYGQALTLNTQAGNYAVNVQPNGTTVAQFYQDYSYFPGLDFSISRVNSTHGAANYFRGDTGHLVIGTSGTLYLNYGGNTTNITGNTTVSGGLGVSGIASAGARKLSLGILDLNSGVTPAQYKIKTSIPWNYGGSDFTVNIKGFRYGTGQMVSLSIGWHYYNNEFYNRTAISNGAWAPTISLAKSSDGYVIIYIPGPDYWPKLYIESVYSSNSTDSYTSGWSWSDANLSDCTLIQTVPYGALATNISGNSGTTSQTNFSSLTINSAAVATQAWVGSQGYLTSVSDVWVNTTGDTMTGSLLFTAVANNVRLEKSGSFLNLLDTYSNIHLYNGGDGIYIDSNVHYWRSQGATHWMALNSTGLGIGTQSPETKLHVSGGPITLKGGSSTDQQIVYNYAREYVNGIYNSSGHFRLQDNSLSGTVYQWDGSTFAFPNGNIGIGTTTPQKKLDVFGSAGIVTSIGSNIGPGQFAGLHFGYSESYVNNDSYKKSALVFERTDSHGQGGNASGKIHFLLNNITSTSANALTDSVVTIDSDASATVGSVRMGIGTRNPSRTLDVNGEIGLAGRLIGYGKNALQMDDSWLRLNQEGHFGSGVYTPGVMRADGGFYIGGNAVWYPGNDGSGSGLDADLLDGQHGSYFINTSNIGSQSVASATTSTSTYRGIIEDTRAAERTPNDYDDYRVSWEFTNQIPGLNYSGASWWSAMTMQGWHNGYSAWQIIGSSSNAIDDFYLRAGNNTTWNTARRIWHSGDFTSTNVSNWNTAYGWGNHASAGYLTSVTAHTQAWSTITSTPTTISGYGITNAYTDTQIQNFFNGANAISGYNKSNWDTAYGWGNHASSGYIVAGSTISDTGSWTNATKFKSSGDIANSGAGNHSLQIFSDTNNDAFIAFHISGDHAVYFGLDDASNRLHTGGWSDGANKYQLWDTRDFTSTNISNWSTSYSWGNHASAGYATTSYVTTQINNLIAGAPGVLDTLDELAAALGDDSNFATTVTNSIATKLPLAGGTMTGDINWTQTDRGLTWNMNTDGAYIKFYNTGDGDTNSRLEYATSDNGDEYHRWVIGGTEKMTLKWAGLTINGTITATGYNNSNWDTAYGWGNHASAGYALNSALANYLPLSGGSIGGALTVNGNLTVNGTITENSSIKLKENVETSEGNLEKVVNLRPVTYNKIGSQTTELGLIAEEVAEVYPEFVQYDENGEPIGVHYSRLTAALIGAVKELTNQVQELNKKING